MVAMLDGVYYQIGIISFGTKECATGIPAVYTRVSVYLDWISGKMEPWTISVPAHFINKKSYSQCQCVIKTIWNYEIGFIYK